MRWLFRNRRTGQITIVQWPNAALAIFLVASAIRVTADPSGTARTVLTVVIIGALLVWAADELVRGVNPFRRLLGAVFIVWTLVGLASR